MTIDKTSAVDQDNQHLAFGRLLKFWRSVHSQSQESLALNLNSSPRHISFLENGKAHPSKEMVLKIASQLSLGERDRYQLLVSAGYTPSMKQIDFHSESPKWLRKAMILTLRAMDPYPATLIDSTGKILMINKGWLGFFSLNVEKNLLDSVENYFDFIFSRKGASNIISGREDTLSVILMSLTQMALMSNDQSTLDTVERLSQLQDVPEDWQQRGAKIEPMTSYRVQLNMNGVLRRFYNVTQSVNASGTTSYAAESQLIINTLYPEDDTFDLSSLINNDLAHPLLFY